MSAPIRMATVLLICLTTIFAVGPVGAQHGRDTPPAGVGAQPSGADPTAESVTESELLNEIGKLQGRVTIPDGKAAILVQPQGRTYQSFHERWLPWIGAVVILGMAIALAVFYLINGRIPFGARPSGRTIVRFNRLERFNHWMTAASFIVLAITGLNYVFGKRLLFPLIGPDAFATWSQWAKFAHNAFAFPFMLGIVIMAIVWLRDNLPDRYDWPWLRSFGGFVSGEHPPAGRFNAGQKLIFWSVVLGGLALSASGLVMLFPFALVDINGMQVAQYVHAFSAVALIAIILAHIYIGTIGMVGAFEAMESGRVDIEWARTHHSAWIPPDDPDLPERTGARVPAE